MLIAYKGQTEFIPEVGREMKQGEVFEGTESLTIRFPKLFKEVDIQKTESIVNKVSGKDKVEIILVRFNNKEIEDRAIDLVKLNTTHPYKLTVYDNGQNKEGLSTVWNKLIKKSKCKYICLLNSDAFVTPGWLEEMMMGFSQDKIVAVGATTNKCGTQQAQSGEFANSNKGNFKEIDFLSGFCMVIKKGIAEFPEEVPFYGNENAWEVIAKRKGYKTLWAMGAYVEHLGGASVKNNKLRNEGLTQYTKWLAKTSPILFTTYNRLNYTKKSLKALKESECKNIIVIDNASTDGTQKWLKKQKGIKLILNNKNGGVAGAMNQFFELTANELYVGKVDNDTIVPKIWFSKMVKNSILHNVKILQAKHAILLETFKGGFDEWVKNFPQRGTVKINKYVGGSGVVIKRNLITEKLNTTLGVLSGWTHWQHDHYEFDKGFDTSVKIKLLDTGYGGVKKYSKYLNYYLETGRL